MVERLESRDLLAGGPVVDRGLTATYYDNLDLTGTSVTRIDPFIEFDFGVDSPAPGIGADTFSARWTGRVQAPYSESFTFYTRSDNGVRFWVNNVLVINNWTSHAETENASSPLPLVAGQWYDLRLEYFDDTGRATIKLLWSSTSNPKVIIPTERLSSLGPPSPTGRILLETYSGISGNNVADLTAHTTFPANPDQSGYLTSFKAPSDRGDAFGSRVRGYVVAPESGDYTFWIAGDNEAQLFLSNDTSAANKRLIASSPAAGVSAPGDWDEFGSQRSAPVRLVAGQRYYIEALHKEGTASDHLAVGWELPSGVWERPIPASRLLPLLPEIRLFSNSHTTHESTTAPATFTVVRDDDTGRDLAVRYFLGGGATNGIDYAPLGGTVVIPRGQRSAEITITPIADGLTENKETVVLMLAPSDDYLLGPPSTITATGAITDGLPQTGGTSLLPANPLTTVGFNGGQYATRQIVNVSGMPFAQALQINTHTLPANVWDVQLRWNNTAAITQGNTLFATFWLRNADATKPEANVDIVFEMNGDPWTKSVSHVATVGTAWTRIDLPFAAAAAYATSGAAFALRFGYLPQTVQIGGITLTNYGAAVPVNSLPPTQLSYPGHEGAADWRAAAENRIDQIRKAPLTINVKDAAGNSIEGATVEVVLRRHEFGFGSAIAANPVLNDNTVNGTRYRAIVKSLYSRVVIENALKWPNWQSSRQTGINLVNWLVNNGLEVRGHNLVWPNWQFLPGSLKTNYDNRVATDGAAAAANWLRQTVIDHIADEASTMAGKLIEWDVINEPYTNHQLMDILGNSAMIDWFGQAKQSDPNAGMFINDYGILSARGADLPHQNHYFNTIQYLLAGGAPLEGIGMQGHFGSGLTAIQRMLAILDRFAAFGLPIAATEFDVNVADEQIQADYLRDFMTTLFSHASVNGILMWGFWQNAHYQPQAALYRSDWTVKPNGQAWLDLVHDNWKTETTGTTLADGHYTTRGFRGLYDIKASYGGQTKTVTATLDADGAAVDVVLDGTLIWQPHELAASSNGPYVVNLNWTAPAAAVDGYAIERQQPGAAWAEIARIANTVLSFVDREVQPDAEYYYRLRAYRDGPQWSDYSDIASARTLTTQFNATDGDDNMTLRASADGTRLEIYNGNPPPPGSSPVYVWPMDADPPLSIETLAGNDIVTVEFPAGTSGPASGIKLDAGSGFNRLLIAGGLVRMDSIAKGGALGIVVHGGAEISTSQLDQVSLALSGAGAKATILPGASSSSLLTSLIVNAGATLDITDNSLVIDYNSASPVETVRARILSGRGGSGLGAPWTGTGITSSTAARANQIAPNSRSVGYADNALMPLGAFSTFGGRDVDLTAVLIAHARTGDANLDGVVDNDDVTVLGASFAPGSAKPSWALGDFEYNGSVDNDDVTLVGAFYVSSTGPAPPPHGIAQEQSLFQSVLHAAAEPIESELSRVRRREAVAELLKLDSGDPNVPAGRATASVVEKKMNRQSYLDQLATSDRGGSTSSSRCLRRSAVNIVAELWH
jgi:GH35 family endo-1,4-beta-xylanase